MAKTSRNHEIGGIVGDKNWNASSIKRPTYTQMWKIWGPWPVLDCTSCMYGRVACIASTTLPRNLVWAICMYGGVDWSLLNLGLWFVLLTLHNTHHHSPHKLQSIQCYWFIPNKVIILSPWFVTIWKDCVEWRLSQDNALHKQCKATCIDVSELPSLINSTILAINLKRSYPC